MLLRSIETYIYIGDTAGMFCTSSVEVNITWKVNGSIYYNERISDVSVHKIFRGSVLSWGSVPEQYNNTIVSCEANHSSSIVLTSNIITIILQGIS